MLAENRFLKSFLLISLAGLAILGFNLFFLTPFLTRSAGPGSAQIVYIVVRVLVFVGLGWCLTRYALRNRFQVLSTALLLGAIDQCVFKWFVVKHEIAQDPAGWAGVTDATVAYNVATGFLFFAPFILLLGFLGVQLTVLGREWKRG